MQGSQVDKAHELQDLRETVDNLTTAIRNAVERGYDYVLAIVDHDNGRGALMHNLRDGFEAARMVKTLANSDE